MIADPKRQPRHADRKSDERKSDERKRQEMALDEALANTFPASDPVSIEQPGPRRDTQEGEAKKDDAGIPSIDSLPEHQP
jgi:hypothetical protein